MTDQEIAHPNVILRGTVGSTVHGVHIEGTDDRDEMGVCIEPRRCVIGFKKFEQWVYRDQPQGVRSQPGDLDLTIFSLRKWARLALKGNPTVLLLLFLPPEHIHTQTPLGKQLMSLAPLFASKQAGRAFLGYMRQQRQRMEGRLGQRGVNRPELVERYGYDTKYAMHVIRLGLQGVEYLQTGSLSLPMSRLDRTMLLDVRGGGFDQSAIIKSAQQFEAQLEDLLTTSPLPDQPDTDMVEKFVIEAYESHWACHTHR